MPALLAAGCIDFVEPDIPELGAPAAIQATIRLTDMGTAEVDASLQPGLDRNGDRRRLLGPLEVMGRTLEADSVLRNGMRRYIEAWPTSDSVVIQRIMLRAPPIEGLRAPRPAIEWTGMRKLDPDTLDIRSGEDLILHIELGKGEAVPPPRIRQWFLRVAADSASFNISSDGPPPDTIFVPGRWLPRGDRLDVRLIYNQQAAVGIPPDDYVGIITLDVRVFWTVRVNAASLAERSP